MNRILSGGLTGEDPHELYGCSYSIPPFYALAAYGIVWITGLGGFPNANFVQWVVNRFGGTPASAVCAYVALSATLGVLGGCLSALGEEIGWRGFLVPHLAKLMSFPKLALLSGAIWSVWHYPILVFGGYNAGSPIWYALPCFTVMVIGISVVFAWMRLKSGSVWTGNAPSREPQSLCATGTLALHSRHRAHQVFHR